MLFTYNLTVPAGTTNASPVSYKMALSAGKIKTVEIDFPAGCHSLVNIRIMRQNSQIVPLSTGQYITGDDETITANVDKELGTVDFSVTLEGSSPTAVYDHIITIRINVEQPVVIASATTGNKIEDMLYRICVALNVHDGLIPIIGFQVYPVNPSSGAPVSTLPPIGELMPEDFYHMLHKTDISLEEWQILDPMLQKMYPDYIQLKAYDIGWMMYHYSLADAKGRITLDLYKRMYVTGERRRVELQSEANQIRINEGNTAYQAFVTLWGLGKDQVTIIEAASMFKNRGGIEGY